MASKKTKTEENDTTLATWARLRSAGKIAKPHGAEVHKPKKKGKKK